MVAAVAEVKGFGVFGSLYSPAVEDGGTRQDMVLRRVGGAVARLGLYLLVWYERGSVSGMFLRAGQENVSRIQRGVR